jgi:hypothetical protein
MAAFCFQLLCVFTIEGWHVVQFVHVHVFAGTHVAGIIGARNTGRGECAAQAATQQQAAQ